MLPNLSRETLQALCEELGYDSEVVRSIQIEPTIVRVETYSRATRLHTTQEHFVDPRVT